MRTKHTAVAALLLTGLLALGAALPPESDRAGTQILYLVRHAEKASEHGDPDLSPAGRTRAETLAWMLRNADLRAVFSTDYRRTRQTAAPTATGHGLEVSTYDPREKGLAARLARAPGDALVVGHSNTIPQLLRQLGTPYESKLLDGYDDLFVVFRHTAADGTTTNRLATLRFPAAGSE